MKSESILPIPVFSPFHNYFFFSFLASCRGRINNNESMDTWASTVYTVNASILYLFPLTLGADPFLDYISLRVDESTGIPYISKTYPK